ncbi:DUF3995 domain-containing protein [Actinotalea sp. AC32]|nr:DUF3995 domain-containing protein [Actinotalea sp. AC32]
MTTTRRARRALSLTGAALIAGAAGIHVLWATGSAWPARDRRELAEVVAGADEFPGPVACVAVASLLAGAAVVVGAGDDGRVARTGRAGVAGVFAVRGLAGLAAGTGKLVPWTPSDRFVRVDRRVYSPLCLTIAALVLAGAPRARR